MSGRIICGAVIPALILLCVTNIAGDENDPRSIGLSEAADIAVSASTDLYFEHMGLKILENSWLLGFRNYLPRLSLSVQENDRLQEIGADSFVKNYGINAEQLLWDGGRLLMSRRLEKMELNLAHARLDRMATDIAESAIFAYYNILRNGEIIGIKNKAIEFISEQLIILEREVELGLALTVDLAEAELALADARIEIISLESDLVEFERQFAELLGLEELPLLTEKIDVNRALVLPSVPASVSLAREKNPELAEAGFSIEKRQAELKVASRSWIPTLKLTGGFTLNGSEYPLNRHNWSIGLNIDFASPWLQNTFAFQRGWEAPKDQTAALQNNFSPMPNPAASLGKRQAETALRYEREKYSLALERMRRAVERAVEKCLIADNKRRLALETVEIAFRRYGLEEIRLSLGHITRLELMESHFDYTGKEINAVEAAFAQIQAERELERLLDLKPGELAVFARLGLSN